MFGLFKSPLLYLKIFPDKMEMINLSTGEAISRTASFSNSRLLIAEFKPAEVLAKDILKELGLSNKRSKILVQQMVVFEEILSETEKRTLRDLCELLGAGTVLIATNSEPLSREQAMEILKTN